MFRQCDISKWHCKNRQLSWLLSHIIFVIYEFCYRQPKFANICCWWMFVLFISAYCLPQNAGDIARKYIKHPELLSFIDTEVWIIHLYKNLRMWSRYQLNWFFFTSYLIWISFWHCSIVSTVNAKRTPMINASMVIFF